MDLVELDHDDGPESKRRKIRKGTRSCWECKRRKMKCSFSAPSDTVCIQCRKRGTTCLGQDQPEEEPGPSAGDRGGYISDRLVRVEALLEQLVNHIGDGNKYLLPSRPGSTPTNTNRSLQDVGDAADSVDFAAVEDHTELPLGLHSSHSGNAAPSAITSQAAAIIPRNLRYEGVSAALYAALPLKKDIDIMIRAGINVSIHKIITHPLTVLKQDPGAGKANLAEIPTMTTHPALLAKYLLMVATCLQFAHPELHAEAIQGLSEPPRQLMHRLADTALTLVTSNDEFLGSIEGLECVLLEAMYHANGGNLRRAWFSCRRAMLVAQMMGIHRSKTQHSLNVLDPSEPIYPNFIWYRIICTDRQLSLMLGLPQGSLDVSMASEIALSSDTPEGRFERKQTAIASRVLERNESSNPAILDDFPALMGLDAELQGIANDMPSKWWLVPNLATVGNDTGKAFWEMLRLLDQVFYFNLMQLLHLPYVLRSSSSDTVPGDDSTGSKYEYSKLASINASRELLTRFIMFRSFNRVAFCCRSVDFFALTASMTLIIAHLDGHRIRRQNRHGVNSPTLSMLAYQRNGDRAMMEQVLENMEAVARLNTDVLSERSSSLLRSLLALEAGAASETQANPDKEDGQSLRIEIPYFGTIRIGREGVVLMEHTPHGTSQSQTQTRHVSTQNKARGLEGAAPESDIMIQQANSSDDVLTFMEQSLSNNMPSAITPVDPQLQSTMTTQATSPQIPQFTSAINEALQQEYLYPGLTAGVDDWTFQGVDLAFFDSLIRGSGMGNSQEEGNEGAWEDSLPNV